jgi:hypothetical protein
MFRFDGSTVLRFYRSYLLWCRSYGSTLLSFSGAPFFAPFAKGGRSDLHPVRSLARFLLHASMLLACPILPRLWEGWERSSGRRRVHQSNGSSRTLRPALVPQSVAVWRHRTVRLVQRLAKFAAIDFRFRADQRFDFLRVVVPALQMPAAQFIFRVALIARALRRPLDLDFRRAGRLGNSDRRCSGGSIGCRCCGRSRSGLRRSRRCRRSGDGSCRRGLRCWRRDSSSGLGCCGRFSRCNFRFRSGSRSCLRRV